MSPCRAASRLNMLSFSLSRISSTARHREHLAQSSACFSGTASGFQLAIMASVLEVVRTREQSQSFLKELLSPGLNAPTHHPTAAEESNRQVERARNSSTPVIAIAGAKHDCEPARNENIAAKVDLPSTEHCEDLQAANTSQSSSPNNRELEQPDTSAKAKSSQDRKSVV